MSSCWYDDSGGHRDDLASCISSPSRLVQVCAHAVAIRVLRETRKRKPTELVLFKSASVPSATITLITASHTVKPTVRAERLLLHICIKK